MVRFPSRPALTALAVLGALFAACSDDESPAASSDPCDDPNTTCLTLRASPDKMTYGSTYNSGFDYTWHDLNWDVSPAAISNYGPGRRIIVTLLFDPPLQVRYDHPSEGLILSAGPTAGCVDRYATPTSTLASSHWTDTSHLVECTGNCTTGWSRITLSAGFDPLATGDELASLTFEVKIPATYTTGPSQGTPVLTGNLPVVEIWMHAEVDGNSESDPPAWPQGYPVP